MTPSDLRAARKTLGLTQKGLAKELRMGAHGWQSISAWESDADPRNTPGPVQVAIECLISKLPGSTVPPKNFGKAAKDD